MKRLILATLLAATAIPTASAQPTEYVEVWAQGRMRYVDVYTGDLNLTDQDDREEAVWRIHQASYGVCEPVDLRAFDEMRDWRECRVDAFESGMAELEGRPARHRRGHVTIREYPPED